MRKSSALALLLALAACGEQKTDTHQLARAEAQQRAEADDQGRILCAEGDASLTRTCTVDRETSDAGLVLTVRHPDGAFHRLLVTTDGRGVVAADGAQPAKVTIAGPDQIDVAIGNARYRLPATVKGKGA